MNELETLRTRLAQEGRPFFSLIETNLYANSYKLDPKIFHESLSIYLENHEYRPDSKGVFELRSAVSAMYDELGPEEVIITSGSSESYLLLFDEIIGRKKKILISRPTYPLLEELIKRSGNEIVHYPRLPDKDWQIDLDFIEIMANKDTGAIVVVSPDNPTGAMISEAELDGLSEIASRYQIPIIFDEVFNYYELGPKKHLRLKSPQTTVFYLNGASKLLTCPDLKVSWIAVYGPEAKKVIDKLELANDNILSSSPINQNICLKLINSPNDQRERLLGDLKTNLKSLNDGLCGLGGAKVLVPDGGFHACILIDRTKISSDFDLAIKLLENHGLYMHPGSYYRLSGYGLVVSLIANPIFFAQKINDLKLALEIELES